MCDNATLRSVRSPYKAPVVDCTVSSPKSAPCVICDLFHCLLSACPLLLTKLLLFSTWNEDTIKSSLSVVLLEGSPVYAFEEGMALYLL